MAVKRKNSINRLFYFRNWEEVHPIKTMVYLFLFMSFIAIIFSIYFFEIRLLKYPSQGNLVHLPDLYIVGTLVLFASLIPAISQISLYKAEKIDRLKINYYLIILLSATFMVIQLIASYKAQLNFINNENQQIVSYIIYITGMHLIHLVITQIFSVYLLFRIVSSLEDPVKTLVFVTNPFEKLMLELNRSAWIYQTLLWVVLFLYLLFRF